MRERVVTPGARRSGGFTLVEMVAAALITSMLAAGAMASFVAAARMASQTKGQSEVSYLAQQTLEKYRNRIACALTSTEALGKYAWYDETATCAPNAPSGAQTEPLPLGTVALSRTYSVTPVDCDGDTVTGDCLQVRVVVQY